jgi:hypothetical protein
MEPKTVTLIERGGAIDCAIIQAKKGAKSGLTFSVKAIEDSEL